MRFGLVAGHVKYRFYRLGPVAAAADVEDGAGAISPTTRERTCDYSRVYRRISLHTRPTT
jgi:hypothetical protein